ncbi:hypothetical protein PSEUBRA_003986 [Kalmanozyma brasiliensis GHG001]|uniref:uncharacterized protein n=1 Tax=Kalmanozyma brasiliensis (strain GHG001) TaxID=1365824 RepID=UPI002867F083|nr:uncharacterized protein PSEUBRA_003986 [Kalmanozyma brasiliensis GHG001]KAF6767323.1 hypothetical protein PSEUBRA_003986 [Kalmanozyma brasiliensis GHG001]
MKTQASFLLAMATLAGLAKAGWETPTGSLSWDTLCGRGDPNVSHVCFVSSQDVSGITINTRFHGFYLADNNFVIYESGANTAFYSTERFQITVNFDADVPGKQHCAAYDVVGVADPSKSQNGIYCPGQGAVNIG